MTFGEYFKQLRINSGYGLREYSALVGIDSGNLSKIETGKHSPPNSRIKVREMTKHMDLKTLEFNKLCDLAFDFHFNRLNMKLLSVIR